MIRRHPYALPALGAALLMAGVVGVQLGESAVAEINPIYFQGAAVHPRDRGAALDPQAVEPAEAGYAQAYGWDAGNAARIADCDGCDVLTPYEAFAYVEPVRRIAAEHWQEPEPAVALQPWPPGEVAARRERDIERYTGYPIEEKRVEAPSAPDAPEAVEAAEAPEIAEPVYQE